MPDRRRRYERRESVTHDLGLTGDLAAPPHIRSTIPGVNSRIYTSKNVLGAAQMVANAEDRLRHYVRDLVPTIGWTDRFDELLLAVRTSANYEGQMQEQEARASGARQ